MNSYDRMFVAGALAGPIFLVSAVGQMVLIEDFDITRHALSQLANGRLGWIQIVTFVVTGLGCLALAAGLRRVLTEGVGHRALPVSIAVFGAGLILAGLFTTDPVNGFPAGAPDQSVAAVTWHGIVHGTANVIAFAALAVAAIVVTVRCARRRAVLPAVVSGMTALVLLLPMSSEYMSVQLALTGLVAFAWTTGLALALRPRVA
jgi:hypothetical protein